MADKDANGWWDVPESERWLCPKCGEWSPHQEWAETEVYCEDCGSHDGRICPRCEESFDHVWGSKQIAEAMDAITSREEG
jgi:hypothetical protein